MTMLEDRVVACRHWKWMAGMRVHAPKGMPAGRVQDNGLCIHGSKELRVAPSDTPDLSDPATVGCLLWLVREAWADIGLCCMGTFDSGRWGWRVSAGKRHGRRFNRLADTAWPTEVEALVAALEAAP